MSARRQASTTSLSKYARANSPGPQNRSSDFCNAFWGIGDGGVDVLFARMRGAARTMDELKNFWKERSAIEEDYAKRLAKLAKMTLGKDEIGELRNSLDTLRLETDKQSGYHMLVAQQIRTDLEGQTSTFYAKQMHHKKAYQSAIEKEFKAKQTQESYVNKAREKYEQDCMRINSYTAQSNLVQGKDLERITLKLERAQQTVQANERDFANFARALQDTVQKWEQDWKGFCDMCQDLEEERLEFTKDNLWAYANAISTVCVSDDESCEKMRLALEQMEPEKDMENFVRDYGTGNLIADPPSFVNYNNEDGLPPSSSRPTTRPAHFTRSSQRVVRPPPPQQEEEPITNAAGVGAGGSRRSDPPSEVVLTRQATRGGNRAPVNGSGGDGYGSSASGSGSSPQPVTRQPLTGQSMRVDPNAEPIDPTAETMLKVGSRAYKVDPSNDPQQQGSSRASGSGAGSALGSRSNGMPNGRQDSVDPLAQQLEDLKSAVSGSGSTKKNGTYRQPDPRSSQGSTHRKGTLDGPSSLSLPSASSPAGGSSSSNTSQGPVADYRNSAEMVVGVHPSVSRPASPNPPTAAFMVPKNTMPSGSEVIAGVLTDYHQSLPGERKSGSASRRGSFVGPPPTQSPSNVNPNQNQGQNLTRPLSQVGHPGIGAHGGSRSNSPQPMSRSASPAANARNSYMAPPAGSGLNRAGSVSQRALSPNTVGIALDPNGRVAQDDMAQRYNQQRQAPPQQPQPQAGFYNTAPQNGPQRRMSYLNNNMMTPAAQPTSGISPPPVVSQPQQVPQGSYFPPQHPYAVAPSQFQQQNPYGAPSSHFNPPPPQQPVYQPPQTQSAVYNGNGLRRGVSISQQSYGQPAPQQYVSPQRQLHPQEYQQGYRDSHLVGRTPSPQPPIQPQAPTGQTTEDGAGILFYVKALYDYAATIEEEFDFQAGDIIAVTATPEDGWWSGELLDEKRRQKGRHVFPSNFVCLF